MACPGPPQALTRAEERHFTTPNNFCRLPMRHTNNLSAYDGEQSAAHARALRSNLSSSLDEADL